MAEESQTHAGQHQLQICTIGDLILDVIVLPVTPLAPDADTPAAVHFAAGGQAANVAAWASVLGARSRLICKRGSDLGSQLATAELECRGVEICGPLAEAQGGIVVSIRSGDGHRTMASDRGVARCLRATELEPGWVRSCDVLHVSGYSLMHEPMAEAAIEAARHARRVTVDLASARDIELVGNSTFVERLRALKPGLIFATEAERAAVGDFEARWVIKLGVRGARFPEGLYPAPEVAAVDTTGAGDALAAGYLVGGPDLAMAAAARCVGSIGAMPTR